VTEALAEVVVPAVDTEEGLGCTRFSEDRPLEEDPWALRRLAVAGGASPTMMGSHRERPCCGGQAASPSESESTTCFEESLAFFLDSEEGFLMVGFSSNRSRRDFGHRRAKWVPFQVKPVSVGQGNRASSTMSNSSGGVA
jgi:hypothetical protein